MKTINPTLAAHLAQDVTTICTCWLLTRVDGTVMGFTDHDTDLTIAGQAYSSKRGYVRTAVTNDITLSVDNMDVFGVLDDDAISENDLRNGVYNYAEINVFVVNWADLSMGVLPLRSGWFGEITVTPNGWFKTELRGLTQSLFTYFGEVVSVLCRADFGDSKCKVPIDPPLWSPSTTYAKGAFIKVALVPVPALPADPYGGRIFEVTTAGTSGTTLPTFSFDAGTDDGSVVWTPVNSYTKQGFVQAAINGKSFSVGGLTIPASGVAGPSTSGAEIPITGIYVTGPASESQAAIATITVTSQHNVMHINPNVPGGLLYTHGSKASESGNATFTPDGKSVTLVGPLGEINATLATLTYDNSNSLTDTITITGQDNQGGHFPEITIAVPQVSDFYANGTLIWVTGNNAGRSMEVQKCSKDTTVLTMWLTLPFEPEAGDVFRIYPACNKSRTQCVAYGNVVNFRGEPDLPGQDALMAPLLTMT